MQTLKERCQLIPLKVEDELVYVYINPSLYEYKKLLYSCQEGVRGFATNKDVFVFDSWGGAHYQIADALQKYNINLSTHKLGKVANFMYIKSENELFLEDYAKHLSTGKDLDLIKQTLLKNNNFTKLFNEDEILKADSQNRYFGFEENKSESEFKRIVENILSEDAASDRNRLRYALDVYEDVVHIIEEKLETVDKFVFDSGSEATAMVKTQYDALMVVFSLEKDNNNSGFYVPGDSYIQINLASIFDLSKNIIEISKTKKGIEDLAIDKDIFLQAIKNKHTQNVFIHEFTHFVDDIISKQLNTTSNHKKSKNSDYYNSIPERNAFYIEWLFKISIALTEKYNKIMRELSTEERLNFMKEMWKKDKKFLNYYNHLNQDSKKKFMRRLYNYLSSDIFGK